MNPSLIDPPNPTPDFALENVWGDPVGLPLPGLQSAPGVAATVLPSKKPKTGISSSSPADSQLVGLRIEAGPQEAQAEDSDYQLEVQEIDSQVVRLSPEVSSTPRVPRQMPLQEPQPVINDLHRLLEEEGEDWGMPARKISLRWILGTGLGIAALVVLALVLLPFINRSNAARPGDSQLEFVLDPEKTSAGSASWNDLLIRQSEAEQVFRAFARARVVDDLLPLLRNAKEVERLIRASGSLAVASNDGPPSVDAIWNVVDNDGRPFGLLSGVRPDCPEFSAYFVISKTELLLDWKATTGYGTATFEELERNQGDPNEIRARIVLSNFYTSAFSEEEFQSYQLFSPDQRKTIWGYTRRGDVAELALGKLLQTGGLLECVTTPQKVTLRLDHGFAGSLPNQWQISEMLHNEWITL